MEKRQHKLSFLYEILCAEAKIFLPENLCFAHKLDYTYNQPSNTFPTECFNTELLPGIAIT